MSGVEEISFIDDVEGAASDLAGLAAFDTNGDGILDAADERFGEFGVWRDTDGDGAVDEGETAGLPAVGVASVNLSSTAVEGTTEFGEVAIIHSGTFKMANGATRQFADAALTYFSAASNLPELTISHYDFDRKSKKYRLSISGGAISIVPKKAKKGFDPLEGQLGANTVLTFSGGRYGMFAPVVLDLDGDGIALVKRSKSGATFDYDGDGVGDDTGWISGGDGFLVIDRDNDGKITEASELSLAAEDGSARSGLQGLAWLDSDGNGVVDADDARFGELRVWQDRNGNGRTDAGELMSLAEAGVATIRLTATAVGDLLKLDNNAVFATASFVRTDGTTATAADVSLAYRPGAASNRAGHDLRLRGFASLSGSAFERKLAGYQHQRADLHELFERLRHGADNGLPGLLDAFDQESGAVDQSDAPSLPPRPMDTSLASIGIKSAPSSEQSLKRPQVMPVEKVKLASLGPSLAATAVPEVSAGFARKLALIRQDLGTFGGRGFSEHLGPSPYSRDVVDWYA